MHQHHHGHLLSGYNRVFAVSVSLNLVFVVIEFAFGIRAGSMALIADAGHNLSDVLGLLLAWGAHLLAGMRPTLRRTYGLRRATIHSSLLSSILLLIALGIMVWEASIRLRFPAPVEGGTVMLVAGIGAVINTFTAILLYSGSKSDLNMKGAFLHMAADAGVSIGVVLSGWGIVLTGWLWLDPVTSLVIALVILLGTWELLTESLNLVMDAVPKGIDPEQVRAYLQALPGVGDVHDLHIWAMSTTEVALTAHLVMPEGAGGDRFLSEVAAYLHDRFHIEHPTIQIEHGECGVDCG